MNICKCLYSKLIFVVRIVKIKFYFLIGNVSIWMIYWYFFYLNIYLRFIINVYRFKMKIGLKRNLDYKKM